jgi:hypothetical protein
MAFLELMLIDADVILYDILFDFLTENESAF